MKMGYFFLFLLGFGFAVSGGVTLIFYMNVLPAGLSWIEYLIFVKGRVECYLLPIGLLLITIAIYRLPRNP